MTPEERFKENEKLIPHVYRKYIVWHDTSWEEDILQEGALALWKACTRYDDTLDTAFSTFAVSCIYNAMIKFVTRDLKKMCQDLSMEDVVHENKDGSTISLEDVCLVDISDFSNFEIRSVLEEVFSKCTDRMKKIAMMHISGYKYLAIANELGITKATVSRDLSKFKQIFKEIYEAST